MDYFWIGLIGVMIVIVTFSILGTIKSRSLAGETVLELNQYSPWVKKLIMIMVIFTIILFFYLTFIKKDTSGTFSLYSSSFWGLWFIHFYIRMINGSKITNKGILREIAFVPYDYIIDYSFRKISRKKEKYSLIINYKKPGSKGNKRIFLNVRNNKEEVKKVLDKYLAKEK